MALGDAAQPQAVRSHRVVLDAYAFIKGWLIATTLWVGVLLLLVTAGYVVPALRDGTDAGHVWGLLGIVILYGFGVSVSPHRLVSHGMRYVSSVAPETRRRRPNFR